MKSVLLTGATGYIGGRLAPVLAKRGHRVRCLVRDPERLAGRPWRDQVDVFAGDVLDESTLAPAMVGADAAFYLVHSMRGGDDFHERDLRAARGFAACAAHAGVKRIVYLGGLGDPEDDLSHHLRSRQLTGEALREGGVPVTELRAAVVVGSGSVSFEMVRYLAERLPVMVCPRWVYTRTQPIAVDDVLAYLVAAMEVEEAAGSVIEIGGADVLTYEEMMLGYARARGLRRLLIPVPVLTPRLSSHWVYWMTPIPRTIAQPLIEGLRSEVVVHDDRYRRIFPAIDPIGYEEAVARALRALETGEVETSWADALASSEGDAPPVRLVSREGMIMERRQLVVDAAPQRVFETFCGIGGDRGWPHLDLAWQLRAVLDRAAGGPGFRRGRRDPDELRAGDALDFWRVEVVERGRLLRLRAEMRLPGRGWLQFESRPRDDGRTLLVQSAFFAPKGVPGLAYWYLSYPAHKAVFSGMIARLAEIAEGRRPRERRRSWSGQAGAWPRRWPSG